MQSKMNFLWNNRKTREAASDEHRKLIIEPTTTWVEGAKVVKSLFLINIFRAGEFATTTAVQMSGVVRGWRHDKSHSEFMYS